MRAHSARWAKEKIAAGGQRAGLLEIEDRGRLGLFTIHRTLRGKAAVGEGF